ncbi:polyphosphate kinase 1 [Helcococcus kunzii]|uniref:Polyphosphate kinase n=1 Tax=Helcococcus kunzii ATCC 51366 TaxID=883114 RepID=H3NMM3_9FIRM|nr:polyphosphate kinase 1 [Helcococcus kunzii]EHR34842.1 polyphosphate kinase 1 [Helcococcus kunzii ATCC 51366]MCT1796726.1 polyphosphate kinase 1 [Helcococcus kunzii]MCT1988886.1 polyphosphate kinase 1 [Helcococcus kunzii]
MSELYMQNRELSWLKFNERVLEKGTDEDIPLYERLKFLSIFDSNLTEFFNVRVGSLTDLTLLKDVSRDSKTGMTPQEQLNEIYKECITLYAKRDAIYNDLETKLRENNIGNLKYNELNEEEKAFINNYFNKNIMVMISPNIIDKHHPFPFIENDSLYILAELKTKKRIMHLILPVRDALPPLIKLPNSNNYIMIEEIIINHLDKIVPNFEIVEKYVIRLTRNADIDLDQGSDEEIDYKEFVQQKLRNRRKLVAVRMETDKKFSEITNTFIKENLELEDNQIFVTSSPLKMKYVWSLGKYLDSRKVSSISFNPYIPRKTNMITEGSPIFPQIEDHDVMLSYPYDNMDTLIELLKEASLDERVFSIKITLYRVATNSKIIKYLLRAAEEGKEVTVAVELRARFDEINNIDYSEELIQGGVNVLYGVEKYKVHSKVCLITYMDNHKVKYITHIGTGNYNESTAKQYQDMNVITSNEKIGIDASNFFNNLQMSRVDNEYEYLLQSPSTFKKKMLELMDREIEKGENGYIRIKCNSITDKDLIEKMAEASRNGIKVDLVVRGICCIVPGIKGETENVRVISIVGRYLEHARIYQFGKGERSDVYIASADFMTRNTERRVEIALPILDKDIKNYMLEFLDNQFRDTVNATELQSDRNYKYIEGEKFDSHLYYMEITPSYLYRPSVVREEKIQNDNTSKIEIPEDKETKKRIFARILDFFRK